MPILLFRTCYAPLIASKSSSKKSKMKVICAGLSKTGTKSMASALRILGYSVHDCEEHWWFHLNEYIQALERKAMPDFAAMYANVDAITDAPACIFHEEIFKAFPYAKVVLMTRDNEEVWLKSFVGTVDTLKSLGTKPLFIFGLVLTPTGRKFRKYFNTLEKVLKTSKETYLVHNARVKAVIPRDKLLVFNVKQGWKPLCEYLGVEVPNVPFPRLNVKSKGIPDLFLKADITNKIYKELVLIQVVVMVVLGILVFYMLW